MGQKNNDEDSSVHSSARAMLLGLGNCSPFSIFRKWRTTAAATAASYECCSGASPPAQSSYWSVCRRIKDPNKRSRYYERTVHYTSSRRWKRRRCHDGPDDG